VYRELKYKCKINLVARRRNHYKAIKCKPRREPPLLDFLKEGEPVKLFIVIAFYVYKRGYSPGWFHEHTPLRKFVKWAQENNVERIPKAA